MNITATKEKLFGAVALAERITAKKESLPILSCVLLEAKGNTISVRSTNLEAGIEITVPVEVASPGVVAVPAAILSQTLRSISSDKVTCVVEEKNLVISSKGTRTLIKAVAHDEFPALGEVSEKGGVLVAREELIQGLQSVSYSASPSMIRPELGSIYVSIHDGKVVCVATDSFRLAEKIVPMSGKGEVEFLLPLKHAQEVAHILENLHAESVTLIAGESQVAVVGDSVHYMSRIVEGNFPNYKEILPKSFVTEVTLLKSEFLDMLKKARVFSGNEQHIGLHAYPKRKVFSATAQSPEVGEMSDTIDAALSGEDLDINFHIGYLGDCLSSIGSDSIRLGFSGVGKPLVINGVSDASFTYLVMPLNR